MAQGCVDVVRWLRKDDTWVCVVGAVMQVLRGVVKRRIEEVRGNNERTGEQRGEELALDMRAQNLFRGHRLSFTAWLK